MRTDAVGAGRPIHELPDALECFADAAELLRGEVPLVFLDFDGTLSPIVSDPLAARLLPPTRGVLGRLATLAPVAIVSGRAREDVEARVGVPGIVYAGSHGLEISGPGMSHQVAADARPALERAAAAATDVLARFPGTTLERKDFGVAVHYRALTSGSPEALEAAVSDIAGGEPTLRMIRGKKVFELRPAVDWNKGHALRWLQGRLGATDITRPVVYVGDDLTDEDAFRALGPSGLPVVVRGEDDTRPSAASYALAGPDAVAAFLERLVELLEKRGTV